MEKYAPFFKHSSSLFQETAASKAREECARYFALCAPLLGKGQTLKLNCSPAGWRWRYKFYELMTQCSRFPILPLFLLPSVPHTDGNFPTFFPPPHSLPSSSPLCPTQSLQCLKLLCLARQQREEIRLKQEQRQVLDTKRKKENKEQNQGESAGEKSRSRARIQALSTHLAYRSWTREKEVSGALWLLPLCKKTGWN